MGDVHIQMLTRTWQLWDMLKYIIDWKGSMILPNLDDIHIQRSFFLGSDPTPYSIKLDESRFFPVEIWVVSH